MRLFISICLCVVAASAFGQSPGTNTITSTVTGTTTIDRTPPTASAPNIVLNNQDVCSFPASAAVQTQILGFAAGTTIRDKNCERMKLARSLYVMGMKVAGVSVFFAKTSACSRPWKWREHLVLTTAKLVPTL